MAADWQEASKGLTGEVVLEIVGGQGEITTRCKADCYYRNGSFYLLFEENVAEDGKRGELSFSSRLKISEGRVTLKRSVSAQKGANSDHAMEMIYEKRAEGERGSLVEYPTPYGKLLLEIQTVELSISVLEEELVAEIEYLLLQEGQEASRDKLRIRVATWVNGDGSF